MDEKVLHLVKSYILEHIDKADKLPHFEVFTVWKAKVLQNWKYLISSTLPDGMYYEITYTFKDGEFKIAYRAETDKKTAPSLRRTADAGTAKASATPFPRGTPAAPSRAARDGRSADARIGKTDTIPRGARRGNFKNDPARPGDKKLRSRIFQRGPSPMPTKRTVMSSPISTKRTL